MPTLHFSLKNDNCKNSLEKSSTRKIGKNICCRYSIAIVCLAEKIVWKKYCRKRTCIKYN